MIDYKNVEENLYKSFLDFSSKDMQELRHIMCNALKYEVELTNKNDNPDGITERTELSRELFNKVVEEYLPVRIRYAYPHSYNYAQNETDDGERGVYLTKGIECKRLIVALLNCVDGLYDYALYDYTPGTYDDELFKKLGRFIGAAYWNADIEFIENAGNVESYLDLVYKVGLSNKY